MADTATVAAKSSIAHPCLSPFSFIRLALDLGQVMPCANSDLHVA